MSNTLKLIANKEFLFQNEEKKKRAAEFVIVSKELHFQNEEREKRAAELVIANKELLFQNEEKEKRAAELAIANRELLFQNEEKEKRAVELATANKEHHFQNEEKEKRAAELVIANKELLFQNEEKEKRAAELAIANKELHFQNEEKEKRAAELAIASEFRIAATVFESQEGMFITDAKSIILRVNKAFISITGYDAEEVVGQEPKLFSSGRHDQAFYTDMWESIKNTGTWQGEIWNCRKNGEVYPQHLIITAVQDTSSIVTNYVATFTDITKSKAASEEINSLAYFDPLTHLPNRRLLIDRLTHGLAVSKRQNQWGALLFIDLDHFKTLNDTLGHDMGDILLQQVATRLKRGLRDGDTVARLGGDEFVVLLENLSKQAIEAATLTKDVATKIISSLGQPYLLGKHEHHSTPSIGATLFHGYEQTIDELLKQADIAMYQAKSQGRNTIRFFAPRMQETIDADADMENQLRRSIKENEFELYYQLQVNNKGQKLGAEVLIRWIHPERGIILPCNFIPLAEKTRLIRPIGQWLLDTTCAQLKLWQQNPLTRDLVLAVNVSGMQFHHHAFLQETLDTIAIHDIDPTRLKLELTESVLVENIEDIASKMQALSKIGVSFSLDDFGTGYSSLRYLKNLPISQLKIDQSFVRDLVTDISDRAIVRTIITIAQSLGIDVIAEGVETQEQKQYLLENDCRKYQGYLFSEALPLKDFEALL